MLATTQFAGQLYPSRAVRQLCLHFVASRNPSLFSSGGVHLHTPVPRLVQENRTARIFSSTHLGHAHALPRAECRDGGEGWADIRLDGRERVCVGGGGGGRECGCRKRSHFSPALSAVSELWAPAKRSLSSRARRRNPDELQPPPWSSFTRRTPPPGRRSTQIPRRRCGWVGA